MQLVPVLELRQRHALALRRIAGRRRDPIAALGDVDVPGWNFRKSNPGIVPIPPTENRRSSGSWSPCSHPPSTSLPLIHVVGESRL